jgi:hypothetical protein
MFRTQEVTGIVRLIISRRLRFERLVTFVWNSRMSYADEPLWTAISRLEGNM